MGAAVGEGWWRGETGVLQGGVTGLETFITAGGFCSYTLVSTKRSALPDRVTFTRRDYQIIWTLSQQTQRTCQTLCPPETVWTLSSILELKLLFLETVGAQL